MFHFLFLMLIEKNRLLFGWLNAFSYLSTRAILALVTSILLSMLLYPPAILWLRALKAGQPIRELGPKSHFEKKGTPTMGGLILLFSLMASSLLWIDLSNRHFWTLTFCTVSFGFVGFLDDYLKIAKKNSEGLKESYKMALLITFSLARTTSVLPAAATSRSSELLPPAVPSDIPLW